MEGGGRGGAAGVATPGATAQKGSNIILRKKSDFDPKYLNFQLE